MGGHQGVAERVRRGGALSLRCSLALLSFVVGEARISQYDKGRLKLERSRQAASTLSSHHVNLFSVELTDDEVPSQALTLKLARYRDSGAGSSLL